jgi:cell division protein FtsB
MRTARFWGAGITLTLVAAVVVTIAILRAQLGTAGQASTVTTAFFLVLAATALVAGTYLHARAGALASARAEALRVVATPDHTAVAANLRRAQEETLRSERERLLARRIELVAAIQLLNAGVFAGDELLRDKSRHETRVVDEWLDSVRAALMIDQDAFRYFARRLGHEELLARPAETPPGTLVPMMRKTRRSA